MHDIDALTKHLGYGKAHQVRERLDAYKAVLGDSLKRGSKNKILVDSDGLMILRRAKELEEQGLTLNAVAAQLETELESEEPEPESPAPEPALSETETALIEQKDRYINHLETEVNYLRDRLEGMEEMMTQLPAGSEASHEAENRENGGRVPRFERLRQFLRGE